MELTLADAKVFLASLGIEDIPDFFLQLLVDQINASRECLEAQGYPAGTISLINLYALALLGIMQPNRQVTQQRAPSGAAQSYAFGTLAEGYSKYLNLLRSLDKTGCLDGLIPEDPNGVTCGMMVGRGSRCE